MSTIFDKLWDGAEPPPAPGGGSAFDAAWDSAAGPAVATREPGRFRRALSAPAIAPDVEETRRRYVQNLAMLARAPEPTRRGPEHPAPPPTPQTGLLAGAARTFLSQLVPGEPGREEALRRAVEETAPEERGRMLVQERPVQAPEYDPSHPTLEHFPVAGVSVLDAARAAGSAVREGAYMIGLGRVLRAAEAGLLRIPGEERLAQALAGRVAGAGATAARTLARAGVPEDVAAGLGPALAAGAAGAARAAVEGTAFGTLRAGVEGRLPTADELEDYAGFGAGVGGILSAATTSPLSLSRALLSPQDIARVARDPYRVLGLTPEASDAEVLAVVKARARQFHPDVNPDPAAHDFLARTNAAADQVLRERAAARAAAEGAAERQAPAEPPAPAGQRFRRRRAAAAEEPPAAPVAEVQAEPPAAAPIDAPPLAQEPRAAPQPPSAPPATVVEPTEAPEAVPEPAGPPPPAPGFVRLYRAQQRVMPPILAEAVRMDPEAAIGRHFTDDLEYAQYLLGDNIARHIGPGAGHIVYVDVPEDVARASRVARDGHHIIPREWAERAVPLETPTARAESASSLGSEASSLGLEPSSPAGPAREIQPAAVGRREVTHFPGDGSKVETEYAVVDARDLTPSHNPETFQQQPPDVYPPEIQGRAYHGERGRAARESVEVNTARFDPDLALDPTISADGGPPTVTRGGVVVAGNQRTMMLQRLAARSPERFAAYRAALEERAPIFGIDPETVRGMEAPVLVRRIVDPAVDQTDTELLRRLNASSDAPRGKTKDVVSDAATRAAQFRSADRALEHFARTIGEDQTVRSYLESAAGREFSRELVADGVISPEERARYFDASTGAATAEGKTLIERIMYAAAIGDPDVVARAPEGVLRKLDTSLPAIIKSGRVEGWDIGPVVRDALDMAASARAQGLSVRDLAAQSDAFSRTFDPRVVDMAEFLDRTPKREITEAFRTYAADASAFARQSASEDLFGFEPAGAEESAGRFRRRRAERAQQDLTLGRPEGEGRVRRRAAERAAEQQPAPAPAGPEEAFRQRFGSSTAQFDVGGPAPRGRGPVEPVRQPEGEPHPLTGSPGPFPFGAKRNVLEGRFTDAELEAARQAERRTDFDTLEVLAARERKKKYPAWWRDTSEISTPEREAWRRQTEADYYGEGAPRKERKAFIVIGPPAAGKSAAVVRRLVSEFGAKVIDSDEIKEMIPEFDNGINAGGVHIESAKMATRVLHQALKNGDNVVLPLVGKGASNVRAHLEWAHAAGYHTELHFVDLPIAKAMARGVMRYYESGRFVDPVYIEGVGDNPRRAYEDFKHHPAVSGYSRVSTDVPFGAAPVVVEAGQPGADPAREHGTGDRHAGPRLRSGPGPDGSDAAADAAGSDQAPVVSLAPSAAAETPPAPGFAQPPAELYFPEQLPTEAQTARPADPLQPNAPAPPIGRGMTGSLRSPKKLRRGQRVSAPQVIDALGDVTEAAGRRIPQRVGRLPRGAAGAFKVQPEVIRTRSANDIPTAAHEVAHALEKLVFGWSEGSPWQKPLVGARMQGELLELGRALYGDVQPAGGYKREGFAEFVRLWITADDAATRAPQFAKWWEGTFSRQHPDVWTALENARDLARRWRTQGSRERALASIVDPAAPLEVIRRAGRQVRSIFTKQRLFEMMQPLHDLARTAEARLGRELEPDEDPFLTASALRMTHTARVRYMVERGMIDLAGNPVGPALDEIRALVRGRKNDFTLYLWARRTLALHNDPRGSRASGLSIEDAEQLIQELETPEFQLAASKVYAWMDGVLNYAAQASPTFAEAVDAIRAGDPGDYVPLQREFAELERVWQSGRGARPTSGQLSRKLRGSMRRVKDPFTGLIAKAESLVRAAHERAVIDQIVKLSEIEGLGDIIEEVPVDQRPAASATIEEPLDRVNRELARSGEKAGAKIEGQLSDEALLEQTVTFFSPVQQARTGEPIVPIVQEGKVRWFYVRPDLYRSLMGLDVYRLPDIAGVPIFEWAFGKPAALLRAGTTGLRASFGLVWNMVRDPQTLLVNSAASASGPRLLAYWMRAMADAALYRTTGRTSEWLDAFLRLGGEMAQPLGQDIPHTRRAAHRLFQGRRVRVLDPRNWFDFYRDLVQFPESAPRTAELRAVARDIGWEPGQPMSLSQSLQLLLAAKQVTTDFTAAGSLARVINRMVPFHNAAIQGPRATLRAGRRNVGKVVWRGLQLTAVSLLLWWLHKDEEWYRQMDYRERFLNWHFPFTNPFTGEDELFRLPRSFEIGVTFSALPEAFLDSWYQRDPRAADEWFQTFLGVLNPGFVPPLASEAAEQLANKDFFFDTPIVPGGEQRMPAEEQFDEYTSRASVKLGELFGASPRRIDHAIRGLAGPVATDVLDLLGLGPKEIERESELADLPIIGRLFQRGGLLGSRPLVVSDLYDRLEESQKRQASKKNPETREERRARLRLEDAAKAVSALLYVRRYTPDAARRREITAQVVEIAKDALGAEHPGRGRFRSARKRAERAKRSLRRQREGVR